MNKHIIFTFIISIFSISNYTYPFFEIHKAVKDMAARHYAPALKYFLNNDPKLILFEGKKHKKQSLLHTAIDAYNVQSVKVLLSKNVDVNTQDEEGNTPMHLAIEKYYDSFIFPNKDNAQSIFNLLAKHPEVKTYIKNNQGLTPLDLLLKLKDKNESILIKRSKKDNLNYMLKYKSYLNLNKQYKVDIHQLFNQKLNTYLYH